MKEKSIIGIILLVGVLFLTGCSSYKTENDVLENMPEEMPEEMLKDTPNGMLQQNQKTNQDQENNPNMDELKVIMEESCLGKNEEDTCIISTPIGNEEGKCVFIDNSLLCQLENQEKPMKN